jgi:hypothetical protein
LIMCAKCSHLGHVPRDEEQQRRERRHRHVGDERREPRRIARRTKSEWITHAMGDRAPARMFVAVRASAPVAAMPPKNGARMLPSPRPTSSALGSCFLPVMPSAMTAERSDSIAPSIAIANAAHRARGRVAERERRAPHGSVAAEGAAGCPRRDLPVDGRGSGSRSSRR